VAARRAHKQCMSYAERVSTLVSDRERKMTEITALRDREGRPDSFVGKAESLLTRSWSRSNWRSRESILRTVDWLLRMDRQQRLALDHRLDRH
jgi:hypothetical protein